MTAPGRSGAEWVCDALQAAGVRCVFGLPGTQNVALYEALRRSGLRTVVATHERSAAMMANGYYRACGRPGILATIPGPGFTCALTGLAEAWLDSAALVHLAGAPAAAPGRRFQLQALDQAAMASPVVKAVHRIQAVEQVPAVLAVAHDQALAGEPGPVLVEISRAALEARTTTPMAVAAAPAAPEFAADPALAEALAGARRCLILAGQGAHAAADLLVQLAERLAAAVVTTTSGRGVVPEDHPLSLAFEFAGNGARTLNALVERCDLVLAIGCKFSHNGSHGFRLVLPADKLMHVDSAAAVLGANYPARWAVQADAGRFLRAMLEALGARSAEAQGFASTELDAWRARRRAEDADALIEPRIHAGASGTPAEFLSLLRAALPRHACLVTDSGLHQGLARRHFRVLAPRGLITPTNLQSMGFGIGAAIGAALADPERPVLALVGDGGLDMAGLELLTAVRQKLRLTVIVLVDGAYGLIRLQQLAEHGHAHGTQWPAVDYAALAAAVGARHRRVHGDFAAVLQAALTSDRVTLVEVAVGDSLPMRWLQAKGVAKGLLGQRVRGWLRRVVGHA